VAHTETPQIPENGTALPGDVLVPASAVAESDFTFYAGICDICRTIRTFHTEQARNHWEAGHHE